jgi:hypothetical protein
MTFSESITKFETENDFQIRQHINGKKEFDLIEGFNNAFASYKIEALKIENSYSDFFDGKTYNKIDIDYDRVLYNSSWFLNLFSDITKYYYNDLTIPEAKIASNYKVDIMNFSFNCLDFSINNFEDLTLYKYYFFRLDENIGFNYDNYITFIEFRKNWKQIEQMDRQDFIRWNNAQKL